MRQVNLLGYAAEAAADGVEALELWRSGRFALVITDCDMPEMNGYDLARNIRSIETANYLKRTPLVACTAYAMQGEEENCLAAGMNDYLSKPVDLKRLHEKMSRWLPIPAGPEPSPTRSGEGSGEPIDAAALGEISGGNAATERELLLRFHACNNDDMDLLRGAIELSNLPEARRLAHRMKGAGRTVGAVALAGKCERIERAARADDADGVATGLASLDLELERLNQYLEPLLRDCES
jgi:CheY-like chemotaxis protein